MPNSREKIEQLIDAIQRAQGSHDLLPHKDAIISILAEAHSDLLKYEHDIACLVEREGARLCII